ncbi:hypothetical protein [Photobacterium damselae]|uniref:hypothetical protein n=1 Tax=Photobacterium damselae TaxID=38293 RepID=UPI0015A0DA43|nr:hypothetical protein [Photobacterium damselae]NVO59513.1 hypothetical protein [Photobacterium damselae subsp. damselae]
MSHVVEDTNAANSTHLFYDLISIRDDKRYAYDVTKKFGLIKKKHVTDRSDKGFHSFRVLMATAMQHAGVSEYEAAYLLGRLLQQGLHPKTIKGSNG